MDLQTFGLSLITCSSCIGGEEFRTRALTSADKRLVDHVRRLGSLSGGDW